MIETTTAATAATATIAATATTRRVGLGTGSSPNRRIRGLIGAAPGATPAPLADPGLRAFIAEITLRHEKASKETERWLRIADRRTDEMIRKGDEIVRRTDEMTRKGDAVIAELRDLRAEGQAQRAALFRMLDRLGPGGAEPA